MKPLIKWPGGKSSELKQFLPLIPEYDRYIEPFVGGGAMYFHLNPARAVINDTSDYLIGFYRMIKAADPEFYRILKLYCDGFGALRRLCEEHSRQLLTLYQFYALAEKEKLEIRVLRPHLEITRKIALDQAVLNDLILDREEYLCQMQGSVEDKLIRTAKNNRKGTFTARALMDNLTTGFLGGYYLYFRGVFNAIASGKTLCSDPYRVANFYFIREYCYGSMFRYNSRGGFNIPYGGLTYNSKDLTEKLRAMYSPEVRGLLKRTTVCCEDFETLLRRLNLTERDFLFLDPPYDTEFSDYEGRDFGRKDQERLARLLKETKAKFLLVIKNTEFIDELYRGSFRILAFENRYVYNMRSRNERKAQHLIITNIPEGEIPWIRENY